MTRQKIPQSPKDNDNFKERVFSYLKGQETSKISDILHELEGKGYTNQQQVKEALQSMIKNGDLLTSEVPLKKRFPLIRCFFNYQWDLLLIIVLSICLLLLFPVPVIYNAIILPLRIPLGILQVFFVPGYLITCLLFWKKPLQWWEHLTISIGLSFFISTLLLFLLNLTPFGVSASYNYFAIILSLVLAGFVLFFRSQSGGGRPRFSWEVIKRQRYVIILFGLSLLIGFLIHAWSAVIQPTFPLNFSLDTWIHYAQVQYALESGVYVHQPSFYQGYVPGLYLLIIALYHLTGASMFTTFQLVVLVNSFAILISISAVAYKLTSNKKILILTCFFSSFVCFSTIIYSSTVTPQLISYTMIPLTIYSLVRAQKGGSWRNVILACSFFAYMTMTHIITTAGLFVILAIIIYLLIFTKNANKYVISTFIFSTFLFAGWSLLYYGQAVLSAISVFLPGIAASSGSALQASFTQMAETLASNTITYGFFLFLLLILLIPYVILFNRKYSQARELVFDFSKTVLIMIAAAFILFLANPFTWIILGSPAIIDAILNSELSLLVVLLLINTISCVIAMFGFGLAYKRLGVVGLVITGWLIGNAVLFLAYGFLFGDTYAARSVQIAFVLNGIFASITVLSIWGRLARKRKLWLYKALTFGIIIGGVLPFTFMSQWALFPNIEPNTYSEYEMILFTTTYPDSSYDFVADFRLSYLIQGVWWTPSQQYYIQGYPIYPEYFSLIENYSKTYRPNQTLLIPLVSTYFSTGPLKAFTNMAIPDEPLNQSDLQQYNNQTTYDKIYDSGSNFLYATNF